MPIARSPAGSVLTTPPPTFFQTNFPSVDENPLSEGGRWLNGKANAVINNDIQASGGNSCATAFNNPSGPYDDSIAVLNPKVIAIGPDQRVTTTVFRASLYTPGANHELNHITRAVMINGSISCYETNMSLKGDYGYIVLWKGGGNSNLSFFQQLVAISHPVLNDGDVLITEVIGTVITVKHNPGTGLVTLGSYDTVNDLANYGARWASGTCGQGFWAESGATLLNAGFKDFAAVTL